MSGVRTVERRPRRRRKDERGLVIAYFALFLTVLMVSSAFVVDMGSWYVAQKKLQRAADAAALAGAAYLPGDQGTASNEAIAAATKNGVTSSQVAVSFDTDYPERIFVTVTDTTVKRYFSQAFMSGSQTLTAHAIGERFGSVNLGSPTNTFGLGELGDNAHQSNSFAAVAGYCTPKEAGDRFLTRGDGTYDSSSGTFHNCSSTANTEYAAGTDHYYAFDIELPPLANRGSYSGHNIYIEAYDPSYDPYYLPDGVTVTAPCNASTVPSYDQSEPTTNNKYHITTNYELFDTNDVSQGVMSYDSKEDGFLQSQHGDSAHCGWQRLFTIPSTAVGTYMLKVSTPEGQADSYGVNAFSLLARYDNQGSSSPGGGITLGSYPGALDCDTMSNPYCVNVHPEGTMTALTYTGHNVAGTNNFYVAQVPGTRAGSTMTVTLWDPGDNTDASAINALKVLDPKGNSVDYTWAVSSPDHPSTPHCGTTPACSGSAPKASGLDTSGTTTDPPLTNLQGSSKFNDRLLTLTIPIPTNYVTGGIYTTANGGWWKISYTYNGNTDFADLTTWTASISGSPVHLVYH